MCLVDRFGARIAFVFTLLVAQLAVSVVDAGWYRHRLRRPRVCSTTCTRYCCCPNSCCHCCKASCICLVEEIMNVGNGECLYEVHEHAACGNADDCNMPSPAVHVATKVAASTLPESCLDNECTGHKNAPFRHYCKKRGFGCLCTKKPHDWCADPNSPDDAILPNVDDEDWQVTWCKDIKFKAKCHTIYARIVCVSVTYDDGRPPRDFAFGCETRYKKGTDYKCVGDLKPRPSFECLFDLVYGARKFVVVTTDHWH